MPIPDSPSLAEIGLGAPTNSSPEPEIVGHLPDGRPVVRNADGSVSTHRNIIVNFDKDYYLLPTLYNGRQVSDAEAVALIRRHKFIDPDTGQSLQAYSSLREAEEAESHLHDLLQEMIRPFQK